MKKKESETKVPEKKNDFAAIFISEGTEVVGTFGTVRGSDWPDYWWYSVLSLERAIGRKICGARIANGDICTEDPGENDRCPTHAADSFIIPSSDSVFTPEAARSLLLNKLSLSFARRCTSACPNASICGDGKVGHNDLCYREIDLYNQLIMNKLSDASRVGISLTFTQISSIRRLCINEIIMMRNDGLIASEGTTIRLEKNKVTKYGEETEEQYIVSPAVIANSSLINDSRNLSRESLLTAKVQHESKIAQENALAEAAKAESQKKVGDALTHVLKEVHTLPTEVPGVGPMDDIIATHNDSRVKTVDVESNQEESDRTGEVVKESEPATDHEPEPKDESEEAKPGDIVIDEDNNASLVNSDWGLKPLPTRKEVDL